MTLGERVARLNHLQQTMRFKVIASASIGVLLIIGAIALWVAANDPEYGASLARASAESRDTYSSPSFFETGPLGSMVRAAKTSVLLARGDGGAFAIASVFGAAAIGLGLVVWLGLGLSALAITLGGWGLAFLFSLVDFTAGLGTFLTAAVPLLLTFWIGMRAVSMLLSGPWPWAAVARNVLNEAVRMKISSVFIVLLIVVLALTPSLLSEEQPLRYRVQQWLQYGIGISSMVLSLLTLFLSVATVSYEQRDRIIWQTVTKPISRWQYIIGKWTGVMMLNAVLLSVTSFGVYLFTEYLRYQPANGEAAYLVPEAQAGGAVNIDAMVEDRRILEEQVLVARVSRYPEPLRPTADSFEQRVDLIVAEEKAKDSSYRGTLAERAEIYNEIRTAWRQTVDEAIDYRIERLEANGGRVPDTREARLDLEDEILREWELLYRTVAPGRQQVYNFNGLDDVFEKWKHWLEVFELNQEEMVNEAERRAQRILASPNNFKPESQVYEEQSLLVLSEWNRSGKLPEQPHLMLRFKVNSGSDNPSLIYRVTFMFPGFDPVERQVSLNAPQVLDVPLGAMSEDGRLSLTVLNGGMRPDGIAIEQGQQSISFQPDGLELMYAAGGYELNFIRIMGVIFVKLGFVASVSIMVATFLSFPVACLCAIAVLFMAESSVFLAESIDYFNIKNFGEDGINYFKLAAREISKPVAAMFSAYGELKPTTRLVDGLLVGWGLLFRAILIIGSWTLATLTLAWLIFRKRELATYSGH